MGHGALRVWNDDEIAPNTGFPAASPRQHGNHHLCPRGRDHPSGQPRQQGPHRSGRRAGDAARAAASVTPNTIWSRPRPGSSRSGSSRPREGGQPTWGAKPFPKSDRSGKFVTIASGFKDDNDALPIRADARVLATTLKAGESAEYAPAEVAQPLSGAGGGRGRGQRRARQRPRRRRDPRRSAAQDHRAGRFRTGAGRRGVAALTRSCPGLRRASTKGVRWPEPVARRRAGSARP